ncbi:MAG: LicD family protein [Erysipelotrichaceae bacterium]|nr:LicD family protein [Erysipelotrichaceae bacterium]
MNLFKGLNGIKSMIDYSDSGMEELSGEKLRKLQLILTDMLRDIVEICRENEIDVFLLGGTALGAVRHRGFIPWDDDIDIGMTRESYRKFIPVFEKQLSDRYILNAPNYSEKILSRFPKILKKDSYMDTGLSDDPDLCKIFIDIFIVDRIPENPIVRRVKGLKCNALEFIGSQVAMMEQMDDQIKKRYLSGGRMGFLIRSIVGKLFSFRNSSRWYDRIDKAVQYRKESGLLGLPTGSKHYFGENFPSEVFLPTGHGEFEGHDVPMVHDTDAYLRNLYGNYMEIPPLEKRQKHFVRSLDL